MNKMITQILFKPSPHHQLLALGLSLNLLLILLAEIPTIVPIISITILLLNYLKIPHIVRNVLPKILSLGGLLWMIFLFKTIFSLEAGISYISLLLSLKITESKSRRDYFVALCMCLIITTGQVLFEQTLMTSLTSSISFFIIFILFVQIIQRPGKESWSILLKTSLNWRQVVFGMALSGALFFFYPRLKIGLIPFNKPRQESGYSDQVTPSKGSSLNMSDKLVFRVEFITRELPINQLYWIGNVIYFNHGFDWYPRAKTQKTRLGHPQRIIDDKRRDRISYEVFLVQNLNEYLFTLDSPSRIFNTPHEYNKVNEKTFKLPKLTPNKVVYQAESLSKYIDRPNKEIIRRSLQTAATKKSERLEFFLKQMQSSEPMAIINNIQKYFQDNNFQYSLQPGVNPDLDTFLFENRSGFCTHFSSAVAILLRYLNIPTRMISGFHGGRYNSVGGYYTIRERDAHAWLEALIPDENGKLFWKRIDPVEWVAPTRISGGVQDFLDRQQDFASFFRPNKNSFLGKQWIQLLEVVDTLNSKYAFFLYSFNREKQELIAKNWKMNMKEFISMAIWIPILLLLIYFLFYRYQQLKTKSRIDPNLHVYQNFIRKCAKYKILKPSHTGPKDFHKMVLSNLKPDTQTRDLIDLFFKVYIQLSYGKAGPYTSQDLRKLEKKIVLKDQIQITE